ncbi:MAG TPA: alpha/beta hydrolase [Steroidobacteraceae bacterium]|nr:alpha/beta hydrolase [Steroidobacteraceae bacterium]
MSRTQGMRGRRTRMGLCSLLLALAACGQHHPGAPPAAPAGNAATGARGAAASSPADPGEGPRITLSPDYVHVEYHLYGQGEPAVILVHGWACDANYWNAQIAPLKAHYTVVAVNLAGHGASGSNRTDWSITNYAQDVVAVAREIPNPQLVLVGHGMGAAVALAATPLLGKRVIGVIAVEALRSVGKPPLTAGEIERQVAPFSSDFIGTTRSLVSDSLFEKGADPLLVKKVAYDMSLEPPAVAIPTLRSLLSMDLAALLPAIHVPVYAINSDILPTDAVRIRKSLPDFTLDVLDHSGEFLMLETPARFNPLLLKDIAAIVQRAPH